MIYLLQVSTCWIVLYGIYMLFLQKETFFSINRYYLLSALLAGLLIPFIGGFLPANTTSTEIYQVMTHVSTIEITPQATQNESIFSWLNLLYFIYFAGAIIVLSRFLYGLFRIYTIYKKATKTKRKKYILVESSLFHLPFSFFHFIFISQELPLNQDVERVLKHEELHVNQWHSFDIVVTELLQVIFWFNPILIFYKRAFRQSHEFLADAYVTQDHNRSSYGQLLLRQSTSGLEIALANHFFHSQIKKRITMMYKEKSKRPAMVKYLLAIPVLISLLVLFASNKSDDQTNDYHEDNCLTLKIIDHDKYELDGQLLTLSAYETILEGDNPPKCIDLDASSIIHNNAIIPLAKIASTANVDLYLNRGKINDENLISTSADLREKATKKAFDNQGDPIFKVVEEMPRFPGCEAFNGSNREKEECAKQKMLEFIYENLTYPTIAKNSGVQGVCVVQFIVEKDGSISNGKIVRDIGDGCGDASLYVVNSMPKWIPGKQKGKAVRVQYTLPLKFKLGDETPSNEKKTYIVGVNLGSKSSEEINLGKSFEKGSVLVKSEGILLKEGTDYTINYSSGKLTIINSALMQKETAINVSFGKDSEPNKRHGLVMDKDKSSHNISNDDLFKVVEEMPRFSGCEDSEMSQMAKVECSRKSMLEFIYSNIKYPKEAKENKIEGTAVIQMIIEKDGSVTSSKIVRNPGGGTGEEAKRVVDSMPKWIPGKQRGKLVRVQYTLPIKYKLKSDEHSDSKVLNEVDNQPLFPNTNSEEESTKELLQFIYKNVTYPEEAIQNGIEGIAIVKFVISSEGYIHKIKLKKPLGWGTDEVVLEMMDEIQQLEAPWTPATLNSKNVNYEYVLPIKFKLQDEVIAEAKSKKLKMRAMNISPNPSSGLFNLAFDIEDKTPVDIVFYTENGIALKSLKNIKVPFTRSMDLSEYRGQTVFINIIQKGKVHSDKIIVQ